MEAVYVWEYTNSSKETKDSEKIIDDAIDVFDDLIAKVNAKGVENKKTHFKSINSELETKGRELIDRINKL